jgi:hypothetical protein
MARLNAELVEVVWRDAHAATVADAWTDPKDIETNDAIIHSIGYLLELEMKNGHVSLAQSLDDQGYVDNVLCIPLENVRRISALIWRDPPTDPTT